MKKFSKVKPDILTVADFETTVEEDTTMQKETAVWSAASINLFIDETKPECVKVQNTLDAFMETVFDFQGKRRIVYFHNLKFDGDFILNWLIDNIGKFNYNPVGNPSKLHDCQYNLLVSSMGQWYSLSVKYKGKIVIFQDSLKLLPFPVAVIGKSFNTKYQKLEMDYKGQKPGEPIPEDKLTYIQNDVLVMKEAMEIMISEGHDKMTIGSCCMVEFTKLFEEKHGKFQSTFPLIHEIGDASGKYNTVDQYIRKSYKGGWCYVASGKENTEYFNGTTCDVNSLYPSMMHSDSGNYYPYGKPHYFKGAPDDYIKDNFYYFVRVRCSFELKENYLPTIQIKGDIRYPGNMWLESSYPYALNKHVKGDNMVEMVMTMTDYEMMHRHYNVSNEEILDGYWFKKEIGFFDEYINKWSEVKCREKGAKRQIAKLFLNNLYGKFATGTDSSYKEPYIKEDGCVGLNIVEQYEKTPVYIPVGAAITSYARQFTITAAQKNYEHFIYADTDSIHCDCSPDEIVGAPEDPVKFNHWKYESCWDKAIFAGQKRYIEHITHDNREPVEPHYDVKCAGMGKEPKKHLEELLESGVLTMKDFKPGLKLKGNLKAKRIKGGTLLVESIYEMH